jgi:hypothetical protein
MKSTRGFIFKRIAAIGYLTGVFCLVAGLLLSLAASPVRAADLSSSHPAGDPALLTNKHATATQADQEDKTQVAATDDDHPQASATPGNQDDHATKPAPTDDDRQHVTATPSCDHDHDNDGDDKCGGDHGGDDDGGTSPTHTPQPRPTATQPPAPTSIPPEPTEIVGNTPIPTEPAPTQAQPAPTDQPPTATQISAVEPSSTPTLAPTTAGPNSAPTATLLPTLPAPAKASGTQALLPVTGADLTHSGQAEQELSGLLLHISTVLLGLGLIFHALALSLRKSG